MGFLEKLHAKKLQKARDDFAGEVISALRSVGCDLPLRYEPKEFIIVATTLEPVFQIFLQNAFRKISFEEYSKLSRLDQQTVLAHFVKEEKQLIDRQTAKSRLPRRKDTHLRDRIELATKTANLVEKLKAEYREEKHQENLKKFKPNDLL